MREEGEQCRLPRGGIVGNEVNSCTFLGIVLSLSYAHWLYLGDAIGFHGC